MVKRRTKHKAEALPNGEKTMRLEIQDIPLHFEDDEAASALGRDDFTIKGDDWVAMDEPSETAESVRKLVRAFGVDYTEEQDDPKRQSEEDKASFSDWQQRTHKITLDIFREKGQVYVEHCCWHLHAAIIDVHVYGTVTSVGDNVDQKLKCSERIAALVELVKKYTLIRKDILLKTNIDELASGPNEVMKAKLQYLWTNCKRPTAFSLKGEAREAKKAALVEQLVGEGEGDILAGEGTEDVCDTDQAVAKPKTSSAAKTKKRVHWASPVDSEPREAKRSRGERDSAEQNDEDSSDENLRLSGEQIESEKHDEQRTSIELNAGSLNGRSVVEHHDDEDNSQISEPNPFRGCSWGTLTIPGLSKPAFALGDGGVIAPGSADGNGDDDADSSGEDIATGSDVEGSDSSEETIARLLVAADQGMSDRDEDE